MEIVKKFDFEMAHIVRNAWSRRCSHSIHGHTYTAEIHLTRNDDKKQICDAGQMVVDFGLVKKYIGPFIDSFDHTTLLWNRECDANIIDLFTNEFERVIVVNESSSCEMMSMIFLVTINKIFNRLRTMDLPDIPEGYFDNVICTQVTLHETKSGRAECRYDEHTWSWLESLDQPIETTISQIAFSAGIVEEWDEYFVDLWNSVVDYCSDYHK